MSASQLNIVDHDMRCASGFQHKETHHCAGVKRLTTGIPDKLRHRNTHREPLVKRHIRHRQRHATQGWITTIHFDHDITFEIGASAIDIQIELQFSGVLFPPIGAVSEAKQLDFFTIHRTDRDIAHIGGYDLNNRPAAIDLGLHPGQRALVIPERIDRQLSHNGLARNQPRQGISGVCVQSKTVGEGLLCARALEQAVHIRVTTPATVVVIGAAINTHVVNDHFTGDIGVIDRTRKIAAYSQIDE